MGKKGYTLFEKWMGRATPPASPKPENTIANPLKLHCGDFVTTRLLEGSDRPYTVAEVREYRRKIGHDEYPFADYVLRQGDEIRILRANPREPLASAGPKDCDLLWLKIFYEMEFDPSVRDAVAKNQFEVDNDDDGTPDVTYDALNAGQDGFLTQLQIAKSGEESLSKRMLRYWDFYRKGDPKKGEVAKEDIFFFVEIGEEDGYTVMLEGPKVSSADIEIYPAEEKETK